MTGERIKKIKKRNGFDSTTTRRKCLVFKKSANCKNMKNGRVPKFKKRKHFPDLQKY